VKTVALLGKPVASSSDHYQILSRSRGRWDKIWEWPGMRLIPYFLDFFPHLLVHVDSRAHRWRLILYVKYRMHAPQNHEVAESTRASTQDCMHFRGHFQTKN